MSSGNIVISRPGKAVSATISLTGSKSESNRALILEAVSGGKVHVENLSDAADTVTLTRLLRQEIGASSAETPAELNVGPAGTAMRFLTAFAAVTNTTAVITGSERMKQRPIGILVDALRSLGARIEYVENDGFPPVKTLGFAQQSAHVRIRGNVSSQYLTALLLVAPALPLGLNLEIEGELTSKPYVEMTLAMLEQAGIHFSWSGENLITIAHQDFRESTLVVEPDWSAASYWYAIAALADRAKISLPYLRKYSLQGDSRITELMANFGITTCFDEQGLHLVKEPKPLSKLAFDLKDCPDLAQTLVVVCAALGHNASFTGLETLKIKETDRIAALQLELAKIGVHLIEQDETYTLDCSGLAFPDKLTIRTYEDHRMAMAFAPLALLVPEVEIEDYKVVEKSYPDFWNDLEKAAFTTTLTP